MRKYGGGQSPSGLPYSRFIVFGLLLYGGTFFCLLCTDQDTLKLTTKQYTITDSLVVETGLMSSSTYSLPASKILRTRNKRKFNMFEPLQFYNSLILLSKKY